MAKANVDTDDIIRLSDGIGVQADAMDSVTERFCRSSDAAESDISAELGALESVERRVRAGEQKARLKVVEAQREVSERSAVLASTPREIEVTVTDENGESHTETRPNPAYEAAEQALEAARNRLAECERVLDAFTALGNRVCEQEETLRGALKKLGALRSELESAGNSLCAAAENARAVLKKAGNALNAYLSENIGMDADTGGGYVRRDYGKPVSAPHSVTYSDSVYADMGEFRDIPRRASYDDARPRIMDDCSEGETEGVFVYAGRPRKTARTGDSVEERAGGGTKFEVYSLAPVCEKMAHGPFFTNFRYAAEMCTPQTDGEGIMPYDALLFVPLGGIGKETGLKNVETADRQLSGGVFFGRKVTAAFPSAPADCAGTMLVNVPKGAHVTVLADGGSRIELPVGSAFAVRGVRAYGNKYEIMAELAGRVIAGCGQPSGLALLPEKPSDEDADEFMRRVDAARRSTCDCGVAADAGSASKSIV